MNQNRTLADYEVLCEEEIFYVNRQNTEEVAYMFNVLLLDKKCKIFLCYSNGDKYEVTLQESNERKEK